MSVHATFLPSVCLSLMPVCLVLCGAPAPGRPPHDAAAHLAVVIPPDGGLNPGRKVELPDAPALRLRPGLEIACRFRIDTLARGAQTLASKDGEYLLRVDTADEGGTLSLFVQIEGKWESRLRGPVVAVDTWYDVRAVWTGQSMTLHVNGETFRQTRFGRITPGAKPVLCGPLAGTLAQLEIRNPSLERAACLAGLDRLSEPAPATPRPWLFGGFARSRRRPAADGSLALGGPSAWAGWQPCNGATCDARQTPLLATFDSPAALLASPELSVDLAPYPFLCLEAKDAGSGWTGCLDFVTDAGTGTLSFALQPGGRPTVISGALSDAWTGRLRRVALSFSGGSGPLRLRTLTLADRPVGAPAFFIRSFAAGRAKLRPGREESVVVSVQNVGGEAEDVSLRLTAPRGLELLGPARQTLPFLGMDDADLATWRFRASKPGTYTVSVRVAAGAAQPRTQELSLHVEPRPDLPATDYVPQPRPAKTDYITLMHYCALWKEGTHLGWQKIEPWPALRPALGWYDEGTPEVADWHIKYALEHGVTGFIYCWYRADFEPVIDQRLGHAIHEGLFNARYRDAFKFTIMWENGCAKGVRDEADLLNNVLPFWIKNYFTHPSYLKLDNRPVLFVWQPRILLAELGGPERTKAALDKMRAQCRLAGFDGLRLIACMDAADTRLGADIAASGWDAVSGYGLFPAGVKVAGEDAAGHAYQDHADVLSRYRQTWIDRDASTGKVPDIPNVVMGWDTRPWGRVKRGLGSYIKDPKAAHFEAACRDARALVDAKPAGRWDSKIVVFDNWTEFGEGHYLEPTSGTGFTFVNALKRVFCTDWAPEALTDVIPEDLGLPPPQRRYEAVRAAFGERKPWQPIRITGDLLADWNFETLTGEALADASPSRLHLTCTGLTLDSGRGGRVLRCGEGGATAAVPAPFFNPGGITVALWCNPSEERQSDRWMLNTVEGGTEGYRLGLNAGRPDWQVPRESWSHSLIAPEPLPPHTWSHVAATFDNRLMRLYVNGREVARLERLGFIVPGDTLTVGAFGPDLTRSRFKGWLDNVRVYRRVLPPDEIAKLAQP